MRLPEHEAKASKPEVTCISEQGIWLLHNGEEYFLDYVRFPQFRKGTVQHICNIRQTRARLRWPDLAIDLSLDLREKWTEWKKWLLGNDIHSIASQIRTMMWDSAIFQGINEARNYAPRGEKGQTQLNGHVHQFINRCFFDTQAMAIRRLIDKEACSGPRSVTSLYRLLVDIENHTHLLTRENMLDASGLPYDYVGMKEKLRRARDWPSNCEGRDGKDCYLSEQAHKCVDSLANVDARARSPRDTAQVAIFQWLRRRLTQCEAIHGFVNKFLAHSATPESRASVNKREKDVSLGQILDAHKIICQIAECVSKNLFLSSIGRPLPVSVDDPFKHFEEPWVAKEAIERLREWRHNYEDSTDQWLRWKWQDEYAAYSASNRD